MDVDTVGRGDIVTIDAGPFLADSTAFVAIASRTNLLAIATVGGDGRLTAEVTIPNGVEPGQHDIVVFGESDGGFGLDTRTPIEISGGLLTTLPRAAVGGAGLLFVLMTAALIATRRRSAQRKKAAFASP